MKRKEPTTEFGRDIRARIEQLYGITEDEYARRKGITPASLSRYILGQSIPPYTIALEICGDLGLDINKYNLKTQKMIKKESDVIDLREEFIRLGIIKEDETISEKQLILLRGVLSSNKEMFQNIDTLIVKKN